ncbi:MAG TPA: HD domain-containing protein [Gammaproteobacteria bacterium]|nr:HD domain-containing protein [Gammaproteobacteria bacterium]
MSTLTSVSEFLLQFDSLKSVNRKTYINGGERLENSAEHSWHLAMACWIFAEYLKDSFDIERLIKLALIHDLGEIDAGDTFLYGANRAVASLAERDCIARLARHEGNTIGNLIGLWEEQESGKSKEARLLKIVDRLLPFLHNLASKGQAWKDHNISKSQVLGAHQFIENENSEIYEWFISRLDYAVHQGWLNSS